MVERIGKNISPSRSSGTGTGLALARGNAAMVLLLDGERQLIHYINLPFGTRVVCWARSPRWSLKRVTVLCMGAPMGAHPLPQGSG